MNVGTRGLFRVGRNGKLVEGEVTKTAASGAFTKVGGEWHETSELTLVETFEPATGGKAPKAAKAEKPVDAPKGEDKKDEGAK